MQKAVLLFILIGVLLIVGIVSGKYLKQKDRSQKPVTVQSKATATPNVFPYQRPSIPNKRAYVTFIVGDSIVGSLGKSANELRLDLIKLYPTHEFVNYNYGFGSTNILSLPERMYQQTQDHGETFPPVINETFDLIIFESFAYNPLSEYPLAEGLKKQAEILDSTIKETINKHPNSVVAIMVPIAPSEQYFAKGVVDLTPEVRKQWVDERVAYIKNAIDFANQNSIPLINVYEKSLTPDGKANLKYINPTDYIHPSAAGVSLISQTIADFILQNNIFPN